MAVPVTWLLLSSLLLSASALTNLELDLFNSTLYVAILDIDSDQGETPESEAFHATNESASGHKFNQMYDPTFKTFLTEHVGKQYDPAIKFETKVYSFKDLNYLAARGKVHLVFGHASLFSCLESSIEMAALATVSKTRLGEHLASVSGSVFQFVVVLLVLFFSLLASHYLAFHFYPSHISISVSPDRTLNTGGGLVFARKDRYDIRTLYDIRGKTVSAVEPGSLFGMQVQWYLLRQFDISLMTEVPTVRSLFLPVALHALHLMRFYCVQLLFTHSEMEVVLDVLNGVADVGFTPSGTIERMLSDFLSLYDA